MAPELLSRSDVQDYLAIFPEIVLDFLEDPRLKDLGGTRQWAARVLFRNVPNEEIYHGLATTLAVKHLVGPNVTPQLLKEAHQMGWCLQMFASCYMILDDIYDESFTRHYKPCWYKEVGLSAALNDVTLLESCVYDVLKRYFGTRSFYPTLLNTFHQLSLKMALSQTLEMQLSKGSLDKFTTENYRKLVDYKMCYYPIRIHVIAAMHLTGLNLETEALAHVTKILQKIDFHFQPRDDYLDVYGSNNTDEHDSETGTDIQERRCTWNICQALEHANTEQRQLLVDNYGKSDGVCVEVVKRVFDEINIPQLFVSYERKELEEIQNLIVALPPNLPKGLFLDMLWASFPKQLIKTDNKSEEDEGTSKSLKELAKSVPAFLGLFPELLADLMENDEEIGMDLGGLSGWIGRLFQYNVPNGKKARGLTLACAYKLLAGNDATKERIQQSYILGWCLEMFQAAALVADDVQDSSHKRRGRDCWYKVKEVGLEALNDSIILEAAIYRILKKHFSQEPFYLDLLDMFHQNLFSTGMGQALDLRTGQTLDFQKFTMERYSLIVKYKTSLYSFYFPVALSILLAGGGKGDAGFLNTCKNFLLDIGHYFQAQDDFLDCYGEAETIGKVGTDIQDGKCSWLAVTFLQRASEEQKIVLEENYGQDDPGKVSKVKELYEKVGIPKLFSDFEEETYNSLRARLDELLEFAPEQKKLFEKILLSTYKRKM